MTEQKIQEALAKYLDSLGVLWTATANGGMRAKAAAAALKRSGVKAGVPDILIFTPPPSGVGGGLAIELKRPRVGKKPKGRVSDHQRIWLEALRATGWRAEVAYGYDHALEILSAAGYVIHNNNLEEGSQ
jgi:hypothetical protein